VYVPLGGNRVKLQLFWAANILITFSLSGLWHGAGWTFIIWGFLHGSYYLLEQYWRKFIPNSARNRIPNIFKIAFIFAFVNLAWVFFRSESVTIAVTLLGNSLDLGKTALNFDRPLLLRNFLLIGLLLIVHLIERRQNIVDFVSSRPLAVRYGIYYAALLIMLFFGNFGIKEFIYFRF
jgi:hypothetical protein